MSATALLTMPASVRQTLQARTVRALRNPFDQRAHYRSDLLHSVTPSFPRQELYARENEVSQPTTMRRTAENMQCATERCRELIPAVYGDLKSSAKRLMRDAQCSERAARDMLAGKSLPSTRALIRLMQANQQIFEAVCEAIGRIPQRIAPSEHELNQLRADVADLQRRIEELGA